MRKKGIKKWESEENWKGKKGKAKDNAFKASKFILKAITL